MNDTKLYHGPVECDTEIRFWGLRRSGNHGVINWIKGHYSTVCHINDANSVARYFKNLKRCKPLKKVDVTIISYENYLLNEPLPQFKEVISNNKLYVLLLRDPFNLYASMINNQRVVKNLNFRVPIYNIKKFWAMYAKEFLGETQYLPQNTIKINFNRWFSDIGYRRGLSKKIGRVFSDGGLNLVSGYGGGSSFDLMKYNNSAQKMDVLNRWKLYKNDKNFLELYNNKSIRKLSRAIFGDL